MQEQLVTTPVRPSRAQIQPAALELLSRHSAGLLATARRYSATPEDAEDAYQRGVEILLTKAPTTAEAELLPWLRTVIKHESFAVRKSSGRLVPAEEPLAGAADQHAWTDDRAERYEQLRVGAEAMSSLKPQEIRCLLLRAEGLSYHEICEVTGFSYTKVNRALTEGRRTFLKRVAGIESGAECERLAPLISKVADGEASPEEMRAVRPHLKGCLACKATLREYRATPSRIAGLVPPVVALAGGGGGAPGLLGRLVAALHDRFAGMSDLGGAKVMAVAASAVVLAGGGAAGVTALDHDTPAVPASAFARTVADRQAAAAPAPSAAPASSPIAAPDPSSAAVEAVQSKGDSAPWPSQRGPSAVTPVPAAAPEFDPGTGVEPTSLAPSAAAPAPPSTPSSQTAPTSAAAAPAEDGGTGSGGSTPSEFAP